MSSSYAASDATQPQNPGLQDSAVDAGTTSLDQAEGAKQDLGSVTGSYSHAASNAAQPQAPGLQDSIVDAGTDSLDRAEDREQGLNSAGITDAATTAMHQGMDRATGEQTPSTRPGALTQTQKPGLKDDAVDAGTDSLARAEAREQGVGYDPDAGAGSHGVSDATQAQQPDFETAQAETDSTSYNTGPDAQRQGGMEKPVTEKVSETVSNVADYITKNLK